MKKESKDVIDNAIRQLGEIINEYPFYFLNEEDI